MARGYQGAGTKESLQNKICFTCVVKLMVAKVQKREEGREDRRIYGVGGLARQSEEVHLGV